MAEAQSEEPWRFDKDRHLKYWKRCLKTYLPSQYTSNDSNRMYLAYFILSSLEALGEVDTSMTAEERSGYVEWIYHCQHPMGGFRMWPGTDFGPRATAENARWDPAHVPGTFFAICSLLILGDDLSKIQRSKTMTWLQSMQRSDGSFGETKVDGQIEGGNDPRFGYCAAGIRRILLQHGSGLAPTDEDICTHSLANSIARSQSFDGGLADTALNEPHAGYTFCGLGALTLIDRTDLIDIDVAIRWLVDRQTVLLNPDGDFDSEFVGRAAPSDISVEVSAIPEHDHHPAAAGMNGRPNKTADTCYCWWVGASLTMLGHGELYNKPALRRYLLQLTQHPFMGGFSKFPGDKWADIYHSFMGLIALSLTSTAEQRAIDGIKEWDAEMCISKDIKHRIRSP